MSDKTSKPQDSRRVARIREVLDQVEELDDGGDHFENAKTLLGKLKTRQRRAIMESALTSHLEVEDLKPYQAELSPMLWQAITAGMNIDDSRFYCLYGLLDIGWIQSSGQDHGLWGQLDDPAADAPVVGQPCCAAATRGRVEGISDESVDVHGAGFDFVFERLQVLIPHNQALDDREPRTGGA